MATSTHIVLGDSPPTDKPPSVGAHYVMNATGQMWYAAGINSVEDWIGPVLTFRPSLKVALYQAQLGIFEGTPNYRWNIDDGETRTIVLPDLQSEELIEVTLAANNVGAVDVTILPNTSAGLGLIGGDLLVPAGKVMLFRLVRFPGRSHWAIAQSTVIGE